MWYTETSLRRDKDGNKTFLYIAFYKELKHHYKQREGFFFYLLKINKLCIEEKGVKAH